MDAKTGYTENQAKEFDGLTDYGNEKSLAVFAQSVDNAIQGGGEIEKRAEPG